MSRMNTSVRTVDEYLAAQPPEISRTLSALRAAIRSAAPQAEEVISYGIPCYKQNGPLVFFAAQRNHLSLYVVNKQILSDYRGALKTFTVSGTTIHFYPDMTIPLSVVKNIVKQRVVENALRNTGNTAPAKTSRTTLIPLPEKLGRPAENALAAAGISSLKQLTKLTERQVADLHGVGPHAMKKLAAEMKKRNMTFKKDKK